MVVITQEKYLGWVIDLGKVEYEKTLEWQRGLVKLRREGMARDTIILVEHPPVITVGKDGHGENYDQLETKPLAVERGGDVTYHGPGQLVVYFVFSLARRGKDIHAFMLNIQNGIIQALSTIGIEARKDDEYTGIWVGNKKISSIGVAVKNWISFHGAAINLNTNLKEFEQINPCGLESEIMTSAQELSGKKIDFAGFSHSLMEAYTKIFKTDFYKIKLEEIAEDMESQAGGNVI